MQSCSSLVLTLLTLGAVVTSQDPTTDASNQCGWVLKSGKMITRLSAMPGGGWDNLRNKELGLVADLSFADCKLSDDGNYILPPGVVLYARKESEVEVMSQVMEHYDNYSSSISASINIDVESKGILAGLGIGGKLSEEYLQTKSIAIENKLRIGRTQLRYHLYSAKMQPDFKLSASLIDRLADIVNALVNNQTKTARYMSDLIVRDFGTHVVTSVEAGGILEKTVFYQYDSITDRDYMQNRFSASMSVSFHTLLDVDIGGSNTVTKEDIDKFQQKVRKTIVKSYGGPILGSKPKLADWLQGLKENLVPVDREGEPLYAVINRRSLPGVPLTYMMQLRKEVEKAVMRYYKANTVKGCMDPNSQNFDPIANIGGQCEALKTNFSFGGVYQTCEESNPVLGMGLCSPDNGPQQHPATGQFSCPKGYQSVLLFTTIGRTGRRCWERKRSCFLFFTCNDGQECADSSTTLKAYWCVAQNGAKLDAVSGMVFGGSYAEDGRFVNELTQSKSCSEYFRPYSIGRDIKLCLSMDIQSAARYRIPFAGFFACNSGNPLADLKRTGVVFSSGSGGSDNEVPKRCPDGFSQVTLDTIDGCAIMQCIKGRSGITRTPIRRPPFEEPEYELVDSPVVQVESRGWRWGYNISRHSWSFLGYFGSGNTDNSAAANIKPVSVSAYPGPKSSGDSSTVVAAVLGSLAGVAVLALVVFLVRRRGAIGGTGRLRRTLRLLRGYRSRPTAASDEQSSQEQKQSAEETQHLLGGGGGYRGISNNVFQQSDVPASKATDTSSSGQQGPGALV